MSDRYIVADTEGGVRLDIWLGETLCTSRSQAQKLIADGRIFVNGNLPKKNGDRVKGGDKIEKKSDAEEKSKRPSARAQAEKEKKDLVVEVVAETGDFIVVNKPAGMLTHPTSAKEGDTLSDWLKKHCANIKNVGHPDRPGIAHRLDKEASGILVAAKTNKMLENLKRQFQSRTIEKEYCVLVYGKVLTDHGEINFAIDRGVAGRMAARPKTDLLRVRNIGKVQPGKSAVTEFFVEKRWPRFTLLRVRIHTGRMHQIRVHMFAYGHPVVGDALYFQKNLIKDKEKSLHRLFLHAEKLCFADLEGKRVCFEAALPEELRGLLNSL